MFIAKVTRKHFILLTVSLWFAERCRLADTQVVSHGLRRLAISTNHFGLDVLRALDKIEPPDKVIVFCPLCLSSSLSMIIMGSSRYDVISSLRHALYIWSMRPREINEAYLDMFNHVGLNQLPITNRRKRSEDSLEIKSTAFQSRLVQDHRRKTRARNFNNQLVNQDYPRSILNQQTHQPWSYANNDGNSHFSLPKLMYLRERSFEKYVPTLAGVKLNSSLSSQNLDSINIKSNTLIPFESHTYTKKSSMKQSIEQDHHTREIIDLPTLSQMSSIHSIYVQRGINIDYNYQALLRHFYKTNVHPVDFVHNGEETRQHINSLVSSSTESKIKDIIQADRIHHMPIAMLLVSAFHFRGTLDVFMKESRSIANKPSQLKELKNLTSTNSQHHQLYTRSISNSYQANTTRSSSTMKRKIKKKDSTLFIETETTLLKFGVNHILDCKTIEIPFKNRLISLVIVTPNHANSTSLLMSRLNAQVLADMINNLEVERLAIQIPVIKFDRGPTNVEGALKELGLGNIFHNNQPNNFNETGLNRWLRPSDIIHETSIDIGTINPKYYQAEDRLKVGASSKVKFPTKSYGNLRGRQKRSRHDATSIKLDGPFLYFVLDGINGLILAMGRVRQ